MAFFTCIVASRWGPFTVKTIINPIIIESRKRVSLTIYILTETFGERGFGTGKFNRMTHEAVAPFVAPRSTVWKHRLAWIVATFIIFVIGFAIVTPAKAETTVVTAVSAMKAIGIEQPGQFGMLLIGIVGVIIGRQSGIVLSKKRRHL